MLRKYFKLIAQRIQMVINDQSDLNSVTVDDMQIQDVDSSTLSFAVQHTQVSIIWPFSGLCK